ncbi:MAG: hypothetical protein H6825_09780 [Planctomycetes bacterium]|nr:hypothetical protein [Planctomycetota bacterium]
MTTTSSRDGSPAEGDDHKDYPFAYGHGRMPFFMKLVWLGFLGFAAWYTITFLLEAVATDLG